jgi:YfiH family protein
VSAAPRARGDAAIALPEPFDWRSVDGVAWIEAKLGRAVAAFSTRLGGVSRGPFASLNLGILTQDERECVEQNRRTLAAALGREPDEIAMGLQVHGARVRPRSFPLDGAGYARRGALEEADGQATADERVTPLVLVADCVPLVLAAPSAVAVLHCGWRGVASGILENGVAAVWDPETRDAAEVVAVLGPCIGPCCYKVGEEVLAAYRVRHHGDPVLRGQRLDLAGAVRVELERLGVPTASIRATGLCTSCHPELFFSHRRDGPSTGRQAGIAWISRDKRPPFGRTLGAPVICG